MVSIKVDTKSEVFETLNTLSKMSGVLTYAATKGAYGSVKRGYEDKWKGAAKKTSTWQSLKTQFPGLGQKRGFFTGSTFSSIGTSVSGNSGNVTLMGSWPTLTAKFPRGVMKGLGMGGGISDKEMAEFAADFPAMLNDIEWRVKEIIGDFPETLEDTGMAHPPSSIEQVSRFRTKAKYTGKTGSVIIAPWGVKIDAIVQSRLSGEFIHVRKKIPGESFVSKTYGAWSTFQKDFMYLDSRDTDNIMRILGNTLVRIMEGRAHPSSTAVVPI